MGTWTAYAGGDQALLEAEETRQQRAQPVIALRQGYAATLIDVPPAVPPGVVAGAAAVLAGIFGGAPVPADTVDVNRKRQRTGAAGPFARVVRRRPA